MKQKIKSNQVTATLSIQIQVELILKISVLNKNLQKVIGIFCKIIPQNINIQNKRIILISFKRIKL